ncbi:aldose epimerase family protein [Micromonospora sp. NPDC126480]|uniref:aldose epimerase family protein n=1 Tax=Micromonospora sp. NPDC126480 TaxID=3155312 RepID=UPI0033223AA7
MGSVPDGAGGSVPVWAYHLRTGTGFDALVCSYGAALLEVWAPDRSGAFANVVHRAPDLASLRTSVGYLGVTMGRYARIVAHGRMVIDGVPHQLDRNIDGHHLHGGSRGFDSHVWAAESGATARTAWVRLTHRSPDGDQGYPGEVLARTTYTVVADHTLSVEHEATTTRPTVVGLTTHAYWNLAGRGVIDDHELRVASGRVIPTDEAFVPTGPPAPVDGTGADLRRPRPLAGLRLDACWAVDDAWCLELSEPAGGRRMRVWTDQPGLALYTAEGLARPRAGLCVQTGDWPDAPNRPDYPSCLLRPGETYRSRTRYVFTVAP